MIGDNSKQCTKCNKNKKLVDFYYFKYTIDNRGSWCKLCTCKSQRDRLKKYPWIRVYNGIKQRCENKKIRQFNRYGGRGIKCLITIEEIKILWFRDRAFDMKIPSIDRENNDGNYEFNNCRFIEKSKNSQRINKTYCMKAILQFNLNGVFIREWKSMAEVYNKLRIPDSNLSTVCLGKRKTAGGFIWKYKER